MHFSVIREHKEFFRKHHWLECEGVLSAEEARRLSQEISGVLSERLKSSLAAEDVLSADRAFGVGRDVWRGRNALKKSILSSHLAEIAGELIEQKPLRFGYDMLFPAPSDSDSAYGEWLKMTPTLAEMSSIQGIACGAMLCICGPSMPDAGAYSSIGLFSHQPGNAVFIAPDWPLPLHEIYGRPGLTYLLIVYTASTAVYYLQPLDPHVHDLKRVGYQFGDRLKDGLNPIVYS